jgi:hypothetical protein
MRQNRTADPVVQDSLRVDGDGLWRSLMEMAEIGASFRAEVRARARNVLP